MVSQYFKIEIDSSALFILRYLKNNGKNIKFFTIDI